MKVRRTVIECKHLNLQIAEHDQRWHSDLIIVHLMHYFNYTYFPQLGELRTRRYAEVRTNGTIYLNDVTTLPPSGKLLGLDLGTKTIGVAISDGMRYSATPLETIKRQKFTQDAERLLELIAENQAVGIVLGLPLNMDGTEGPRAQSTRAFARNLSQKIEIPIVFWDERLSTAAVTRTLIEADTRRDKRAEVVDKLAASYILQGVLERLRPR